MQEVVLVFSRCQAMRYSPKSHRKFYRFHFKGFYLGQKIKEIRLTAEMDLPIVTGEDYLLWVKPTGVEQSILTAQIIKYKKIE